LNSRKFLQDSQFSGDDKYFIFHVLEGIAEQNHLHLVISEQTSSQQTNGSVEKSLFLFTRNDVQHYIKSFSLHLKDDPKDVPEEFSARRQNIENIKQKIAKVFHV
jgi:hypothetical protein